MEVDYRHKIYTLIDETIERLIDRKFTEDPILGKKLSYTSSIAGSTQKRHGLILEKAILFGLKKYESSDYFVWEDPLFEVSPTADNAVNAEADPYKLLGTNLPYSGKSRTLQVDLIIYDRNKKHISAYEIKRGNSVHDAGKKRSILRDFVCMSLLIYNYGISKSLEVTSSSCNIIFYYGKCTIPKPYALVRDDLDTHFGRPIVDFVEDANKYFQDEVMSLIS